jgi:iron complex transport system ATP-binding protein
MRAAVEWTPRATRGDAGETAERWVCSTSHPRQHSKQNDRKMAAIKSMRDGAPLLQIRSATVQRGTRRGLILDQLTLEIPLGENTVVLGPNGSGKSTLIKLITRDYYPLAHPIGRPVVEIFGRARWDVFELRTLLGIVTPDLDRRLTDETRGRTVEGLDAVISGFFASEGILTHRLVTPEMQDRAHKALAVMEASHLADKPMHEISTGEARRVLIARALVSDPPALLLDEPTTGLDMIATHRFLQTLRGLVQSGKTMIFVTHHVHEIIPEVTRVVLLRDGKIFRDGPKHQVLTPKNLSAVFGAPVRVSENRDGYYAIAAS